MSRFLQAGSGNESISIASSLRFLPFRLNQTWRPPGMTAPPDGIIRSNVKGKVVADGMEALLGVVYESAGPAVTLHWLQRLRILPQVWPCDVTTCHAFRHLSVSWDLAFCQQMAMLRDCNQLSLASRIRAAAQRC